MRFLFSHDCDLSHQMCQTSHEAHGLPNPQHHLAPERGICNIVREKKAIFLQHVAFFFFNCGFFSESHLFLVASYT